MSTSLRNFYRGKRVLVTGHTGFKGGWLTEWLKLLGAQVTGFALPPITRPNLFDAIALDRGMTSIFGDVRDRNALSGVFADHSPEILIHNAGQSSAAKSHRDPVETYAVNVMGTVHVLDEARYVRSLRSVVVTTTAPAGERPWLQESGAGSHEKSGGDSTPLASSRSCAESVTTAYRLSFFSALRSAAMASMRSGELIGGGDWSEDRLIPELVRAFAGDQPLIIRRPDFVYPAGHVLESVRGCLILAQRLYEEGQSHGDSWSLGNWEPEPMTVQMLAERVRREWGKGELMIEPGSPGDNGPEAQPDASSPSLSTNLHLLPGWKSALGLDQALRWTVEWYREYYRDPASAWRMTQKQIGSYMDLIGSPESTEG